LLLVLVAVLVGARSGSTDATAEQSLTYEYLPFDQVDPQRISDGEPISGQNLLEGLVAPDDVGTGVVPATADRWTVSRDGTVYTFHIRDRARWSDGTPVTAQDFAWSYRRLLGPSTTTLDRLNGASSYQSDLGIKNAVGYQLGKITDWSQVGVKALDPSHLRIVLAAPNTSFLPEMANPSMVPLPRKNVIRFPYSWQTAAHWVGNGPFVIGSWTPNSRMVLLRSEQYWDRENVHLDRVTISMGTPSDAEIRRRYDKGDLDLAQLSDPTGFPRDALLRLDEYSVDFITLIPSRHRALRDVRVRQAIALAIGRTEVAKVKPLLKPATSLVPSSLPAFDASVGFKPNVAKARRLLAAAGYPGGKGFPTFIVMTSFDDPIIGATVRTLRRNLGIRAVQDAEDPAVENVKRHEVLPADRVGYFSTGYGTIPTWRDWVYKYPPSQAELLSLGPDDYIHYQVLQAHGTAKSLARATRFLETRASPQSKRFAAVAAQADATPDPARARVLYKAAAAIRQSTYAFIPVVYGGVVYAIRPGIEGVHLRPGYATISFKGVRVG
jgi:ABC-type transport system substrate-binding protein